MILAVPVAKNVFVRHSRKNGWSLPGNLLRNETHEVRSSSGNG